MYCNAYPYIIAPLIIRVHAGINAKRGIGARIQFRIQSGILSDGKQVQGLGIHSYSIEMQTPDAIGHDIVTDRQVSAPEKRTTLHDVGIKDRRVAEISTLFEQRNPGSGVGDAGEGIVDIRWLTV